MASRNVVVGTGAALAGVGGLAAAALTASPPVEKTMVKTIAQPVETRTVIVHRVVHRVKHVKPKHPHIAAAAAPAPAPVVRAAPVVAAAPVVHYAPAATVVSRPAPVRTRTSAGGGHAGGGDDGAEHGDD